MVMVEPRFLYAVISKTLILGGLAAIIGYIAASASFAVAVVIGAVITAINMRTVTWAMQKMLEAGREGKGSAAAWSLLLAAKMLVLIGVIWMLITRADVNAVGFAIGFSLFMPAIGWQMVVAKPEEQESEEG